MITKETYVGRRSLLMSRMKASGADGIVVFLGNVEAPAQYRDNCYKFRQDSNWLYFFGIDEPRYAALLDLDDNRQIIFADDFDLDDIIWMGPMPSVSEVASNVGVSLTAPYDELQLMVKKAVEKGRKVHFLPCTRYYNACMIASMLGVEPFETFNKGKSGCPLASESMVKAVVEMRLQKSEDEIAELDNACTLGQQMHTIARKCIRTGVIEQEVVGAMEGFALAKAWGVSFATILTQHGEIFHCHSHDKLIEDGKLIVVDAGLETNMHYASDFTRTYPASGVFSPIQRDIYQIVYECNEYAFSLCKPGVKYYDVHLSTMCRMLDGLKQLDLVRGDVDAMVSDGIAGLFMPHGLGHNMGLDVHDMEDLGENIVGYAEDQKRSAQLGLGSLRMARPLAPGHVVTDEPGIYFIPDLIAQWKREGVDKGAVNYDKLENYLGFGGIRLEDDVLITAGGARRLGANRLPISPDDVEKAMFEDKQ